MKIASKVILVVLVMSSLVGCMLKPYCKTETKRYETQFDKQKIDELLTISTKEKDIIDILGLPYQIATVYKNGEMVEKRYLYKDIFLIDKTSTDITLFYDINSAKLAHKFDNSINTINK